MREARDAMNDRTMVEFPGGDMGDVTRERTPCLVIDPMPAVPNRVAALEAEIARLKAELAAGKPEAVAPSGKPPIPARALRQPATQRVGLCVGRA